jgi:hypothetical protein
MQSCSVRYRSRHEASRVKKVIRLRILIVSFLFAGLLKSGWSQSINYKDLFGEDWKTAVAFEKENRNWIEPLLTKNHISYPLAISIIFPELVRYSALQDKMEITLLKTLYVNLGKDYANFSIGQFQMKPSFAEIIREKAPDVLGRRSGITFKNVSDFDDVTDFRKSIIKDLEDPKSEISYLIAFIIICEKNFKTSLKDELSEVKFLATAYNFGFDKTEAEIRNMIDKKFFNTKLFKSENYSYADVSLFWYRQYMSDM